MFTYWSMDLCPSSTKDCWWMASKTCLYHHKRPGQDILRLVKNLLNNNRCCLCWYETAVMSSDVKKLVLILDFYVYKLLFYPTIILAWIAKDQSTANIHIKIEAILQLFYFIAYCAFQGEIREQEGATQRKLHFCPMTISLLLCPAKSSGLDGKFTAGGDETPDVASESVCMSVCVCEGS